MNEVMRRCTTRRIFFVINMITSLKVDLLLSMEMKSISYTSLD